MIQAAPLQRVVELPRPVRRDHDRRRRFRHHLPHLGDRHRELREDLEQEGLELVVGAVQLVHEQDRAGSRPDRREQGPLHEELRTEEVVDVPLGLGCIHRPHGQQLPGVVPLVQRLGRIDPLVALETDQPPSQELAEDLRHLRLADARFALQEQRLVEREGQMDRRREAPVGQVGVRTQLGLQLVHRGERVIHGAHGTGTLRRPQEMPVRRNPPS